MMRLPGVLTAALSAAVLALLLSSCDTMANELAARQSAAGTESDTSAAETETQVPAPAGEERAIQVLGMLRESFRPNGEYERGSLPDWFGGMYYESGTGRAAVCVTDQGEGFIRDYGEKTDMTVVDLVHVRYNMLTLLDIKDLLSGQIEQGNIWGLGIDEMSNAVSADALSEEGADNVRSFLEENGIEPDACVFNIHAGDLQVSD